MSLGLVTFCPCGCGGRRCTYCGVVGETTECASCAAIPSEPTPQESVERLTQSHEVGCTRKPHSGLCFPDEDATSFDYSDDPPKNADSAEGADRWPSGVGGVQCHTCERTTVCRSFGDEWLCRPCAEGDPDA